MSALFLDYDQRGLDAQYDLRAAMPTAIDDLGECARRSGILRARRAVRLDVPYGPSHGERSNVFPARAPGAPILVFIHGGYWQRLDKNDFDYVVEPFVAAGAAAVNVNYALIPTVTMDEIVRQVRAAIAWAWQAAASYNGDRARLHVAGHSAGAHLAAMAALTDWSAVAPGLPADVVRSATAISGLYDLEPVRLSYINQVLALDAAAARRNSPTLYVSRNCAPLSLFVGTGETSEFRRQQRDFAAALSQAGAPVDAAEIDGRHHFDITHDLATAGKRLCEAVRLRLGL